ncbi:transcription factor jumonji (jmjC) domain-containing protein [Striga hermonthica]|uniref:Transcription factor jumonji (JmjC) domain-containing protein n=1 Tax=Striga hermonthica TaxID=68872 RepID=A0A9N7RRN4_STRHE|nr:transcription factor jumonji (jmjC) domain-containing protein [Striga hermonthica]
MMGRGKTRKVEKGALGTSPDGDLSIDCGPRNVPAGPVYYPSEEEFKDPLEYIYKIRPEAEPYGICKIVPPGSWKPPFALDVDSFKFPTKSQAIHQLQARCAPCDPKTFRLEYNRFLEEECGRKAKKRVVFEGEDLDLCKLFNVVKRFGGYNSVVKKKKWAEVFRFIRPGKKISECSRHVLSQLYCEHLSDYEDYCCRLNQEKGKDCKLDTSGGKKCEPEVEVPSVKRRRKNKEGERVEVHKVEEQQVDQICEQCRSGLHGEVMLLCDRCNKGWHIYCLSPPLKCIPPGNWYCLECLNSEKESFGFVPGKQYSVEAFRRVADRVKKKWFGSSAASWEQMEKKFWEIVEGSAGEVEVMYGSDLDTSVYGSGFPREGDQRLASVEADVWKEYCSSPWNLNNLPRLLGSMLRAVHQNIAGVMVPWLYIGMLFSSFCWHFEDHCFYSMNYLHWGEPKYWYSVPGNEADAFEKVMRSSLPDLFEAQPDLLFQLVTMLNPSVLQEKGVPVYSIIQEPGNFVITFPHSYHGGFNLGLNCAEAVNFAPADWLPHGGFGAELYRHYRKVPVLSHEELLCVVAKTELNRRVSSYLKKELLRIYNNEKTWREQLWRCGIIRSSPMIPRAKPEYVGTEEDPMCVICRQLLYLSAVSCSCRPSTYACLEHWEHLCECKPNKLRLLYRHTLAELTDLLLKADSHCSVEDLGNTQNDTSSRKAVALTKKVKSGRVTYLQLAEDWILRSCKVLEQPYSRSAYASLIEEAEQFLWAGAEIDLVREMQNRLIQARNWAKAVRRCLSKIKFWSSNKNRDMDRVPMDDVNELLGLSPAPCKELGLLLLKDYQEEANELIQEINSALETCSRYSVVDLEILYAKTVDSPIHVKESEKLRLKLSTVKVWLGNAKKCIFQKDPSSVEVDMLYKLESEISELQFQLPEAVLLSDLTRQVKICQSRCIEILGDLVSLKEVKLFLSEWENFPVKVPELELLKKYYNDTVSWMSRVDRVLMNVHEREDQEKVVDELTCILKDESLLKIQVNELPRVELELQKAHCRVKAFKGLNTKMSMDFTQQLMLEAAKLQIEKEEIFADISQRHAAAICWDGKAKHVLAIRARMSDFEDLLRASEHIGIIPSSLLDVELAVSTAKSWLTKAKPFLYRDSYNFAASDSCLEVDVLKELVLQSEELNVHFEEYLLLQELLKKCVDWEHDARTLLQNVECLWKTDITDEVTTGSIITRLECQVLSMETAIKSGISLGVRLNMIQKLEDSCSTFKWGITALSFCTTVPTCQEVEAMLDAAASLPVIDKSVTLWTALIDGLTWLKSSLEILVPCNRQCFQVRSVEEVLVLSKKICISFPIITGRLRDAVEDHKLWLEKVNLFSALDSVDRSYDILMQLKDHGSSKAFNCLELEKVLCEYEKIKKWAQRCADIIKPPSAEEDSLPSALVELKNTLERSFEVYGNYEGRESRNLCKCCSSASEDQELLSCSICKDRQVLLGLAMDIPSEDYFTQKLTETKNTVIQWAETAKKVSVDGGMLGLDKVFELISEGESLPVSCAKELKLLRDRSMLYCICRRPYDRRPMIACDKCDEWYHFDCVKISSAPKFYICPACDPHQTTFSSKPNLLERLNGSKLEEPQTPSRCSELKTISQKSKKMLSVSSSERLLWRNKKPFRRAARKRAELQSLSPFYLVHDKS